MSEPIDLPEDVQRLLTTTVDSFEKIEVLLLAWQQPDLAWTVAEAVARIRLPADGIAAAVDELVADRLLLRSGAGYRLAPVADADRAATAALCELYASDRLRVLKELTALAMDRIRSSAARAFSDAFRFRRRGPGKGGTDA